jgi:hypothetical protein
MNILYSYMWLSEGRRGSEVGHSQATLRRHNRPTYLPKIHLNVIHSYF